MRLASLASLPARMGDKQRLIAILSVLLSLAFAATAVVNYQVSSAAIRQNIVASELPLTSDNLYSEIQKDLVRPVLISSMMASDTFLRDWVLGGERDPRNMIKFLREIKDRYGAFTSFFISEQTRTYYQTEGILKTVRQDEPRDVWYFRVRNMSAPYEINVDPDLANRDTMTIFINYRVLDYNKRFLGVAGVGITMDAARGMIDNYQKRYGRDIYFVDRSGAITLVGQNSRMRENNVRSIPGMAAVAEGILRTGGGSFQYSRGGGERLLNVRLIPELNWFLFVEGTDEEALEGIRRTLYANLIICLLVTAIVLIATSFTINRYQSRLEEMATTDKLTGLNNRQAFDLLLPQAITESLRNRAPLCAILIDLDHFKEVNDRLGHLAGDKVLRSAAGIVKASLRASDIVARWGGEEFLVAIKNVDAEQAVALAEKIRKAVEETPITYRNETVRLTASLGVAAHRAGDTPEQLIARADQAMYEAKKQGRNRVHSV